MPKQPINPTTGTSKQSPLEELENLLEWPGLYMLADACDEYRNKFRKSNAGAHPMPTSILLFAAFAPRVTGSLASSTAMLDQKSTWNALRKVWADLPQGDTGGRPFPQKCPNRDQVRAFKASILTPKNRACPEFSDVEHWEPFLQERFQRVAMVQAKKQGHLLRSEAVDWTTPRMENTIIGDGTVVTRFSDVEEWVDHATGETFYSGSRALHNPRVAKVSNLEEDGKSNRYGLNMVSMLTATRYGWVILGTGYASGAEQWKSLDLLDSIVAKADGGIDNLLWDRVYRGWLLDHTTARHGIRVFNKSVADGSDETDEGADDLDDEFATLENSKEIRRSADLMIAALTGNDRRQVAVADLSDEQREQMRAGEAVLGRYWRQSELERMYESGEPLPLGVCLYKSTSASDVTGSRNAGNKPRYELVRSKPRHVGAVTHADGCVHVLYTDDGGLHSVDFDGSHLVKVATATCLSSKRRVAGHDSIGLVYGTDDEWVIPCVNGDLRYSRQWDPLPKRYYASDKPGRAVADVILNDLRPISRHQEREFADIANARNNAESWNHWYKCRLGEGRQGRAATLHTDSQLFDYLAGACVRNAITWAAWMNS